MEHNEIKPTDHDQQCRHIIDRLVSGKWSNLKDSKSTVALQSELIAQRARRDRLELLKEWEEKAERGKLKAFIDRAGELQLHESE